MDKDDMKFLMQYLDERFDFIDKRFDTLEDRVLKVEGLADHVVGVVDDMSVELRAVAIDQVEHAGRIRKLESLVAGT